MFGEGRWSRPNRLFQEVAFSADLLDLLLTNARPRDARTAEGDTLLHLAATYARVEALDVLLANGISATVTNHRGFTPLHWAILSHEMDGVPCLVQHHAPLDAADADGNTPLHHAILAEAPEAVSIHLRARAPLTRTNKLGLTPLQHVRRSQPGGSYSRTHEHGLRLPAIQGDDAQRDAIIRALETAEPPPPGPR